VTRALARQSGAAEARAPTSGVVLTDSQLTLPGLQAVEWVWCEDTEEANVAFEHATVMRAEVVGALAPRAGVFVDVTLGGGGHSEAILEASPEARVIGFDRDAAAIDASRERLARFEDRVTFVHAAFGDVAAQLRALAIGPIQGLCADFGVSSPQLDDPERGMSFRHEGPLDMRMDAHSGETALEMIGRLGESELADIIFQYGDERRSRRIARSIKRAWGANELVTTLDLRRAIVRAVGSTRRRAHSRRCGSPSTTSSARSSGCSPRCPASSRTARSRRSSASTRSRIGSSSAPLPTARCGRR
jgi:16S rRNA (cytosine1402-N4)-methyltransferase